MDFTYCFPWKYAGVRVQGAGLEVDTPEVTVTGSNGFRSKTLDAGTGAAGVVTGDFILRLPLDDFWPSVHLAPYIFGGGDERALDHASINGSGSTAECGPCSIAPGAQSDQADWRRVANSHARWVGTCRAGSCPFDRVHRAKGKFRMPSCHGGKL
jgi:hypothetical protein